MISRAFFTISFILFYLFTARGISDTTFYFNGEHPIKLRGDWDLVMNSFLSFTEIQSLSFSAKTEVPGTWNEATWQGKKVGAFGFGTYFTTVVLGDSVRGSLAIAVPEVSSAYRLYCNEKLIGQIGNPDTSTSGERSQIGYGLFDFDAGPNDTLTFIFHVSNFRQATGGIWYVPKLGYEESIREEYVFNKAIKLLILGILIISGVYMIYIYFIRREEKYALYFSLAIISLIMITVSRGDMPILDIFPNLKLTVIKKITYVGLFFIGPANALFLRELYPSFYNKKVINSTVVIGLIASFFAILFPPHLSYQIIPYHHIYIIFLGIYLFVSLLKVAGKNIYGANYFIFGYLVAFLSALHDILSDHFIIEGYSFDMVHLGMFMYIFIMVIILGGQYISALKAKEDLSQHLRKVNAELEETVKRRTKTLSEQNKVIEQKNLELEKAISDKDHLMSVVAHDLKAPFSTILGISEVVGKNLKGKSAKFNELIKKVTNDGLKLIEDMTELKMYEQEDYAVKFLEVDLETLFYEKSLSFDQMASAKSIKFHPKKKIGLGNTFYSDSLILSRIIDNLLSNAIKFSPPESEIFFELLQESDHLTILIKDNGPGFNEVDLKKIFNKFQRLSARPTAGESSTGLGLSIVKALVDKLKGTINLQNKIDKGATFIITIPNQV